jgi:hypothetical protein
MNENKPEQELAAWHKTELIGIDTKGLDRRLETGRLELKTRSMNQHFINELDKIG